MDKIKELISYFENKKSDIKANWNEKSKLFIVFIWNHFSSDSNLSVYSRDYSLG